jgi:hypothetical protein
MEHFLVEMADQKLISTFTASVDNCKFFEQVWKLEQPNVNANHENMKKEAHCLKVCYMVGQPTGRLCLVILGIISKIHVTWPQFRIPKRSELGCI